MSQFDFQVFLLHVAVSLVGNATVRKALLEDPASHAKSGDYNIVTWRAPRLPTVSEEEEEEKLASQGASESLASRCVLVEVLFGSKTTTPAAAAAATATSMRELTMNLTGLWLLPNGSGLCVDTTAAERVVVTLDQLRHHFGQQQHLNVDVDSTDSTVLAATFARALLLQHPPKYVQQQQQQNTTMDAKSSGETEVAASASTATTVTTCSAKAHIPLYYEDLEQAAVWKLNGGEKRGGPCLSRIPPPAMAMWMRSLRTTLPAVDDTMTGTLSLGGTDRKETLQEQESLLALFRDWQQRPPPAAVQQPMASATSAATDTRTGTTSTTAATSFSNDNNNNNNKPPVKKKTMRVKNKHGFARIPNRRR